MTKMMWWMLKDMMTPTTIMSTIVECQPSTLDSRYIAAIHNTLVHTAQQLQRQNLGQFFARTLRASYWVFFVSYWKKWPWYNESAL